MFIDGGSLEHVFNFPQAIKNCMEMVNPSGHYIGITLANNFLGYGFYQFSPELYYRVFREANGFEMFKMFFFTIRNGKNTFEVSDPKEVGERISLVNSFSSYLFVITKKTSEKDIFGVVPQQSDYELVRWKYGKQGTPVTSKQRGIMAQIKAAMPLLLKRKLRQIRNKSKNRIKIMTQYIGVGNPKHIHKVSD